MFGHPDRKFLITCMQCRMILRKPDLYHLYHRNAMQNFILIPDTKKKKIKYKIAFCPGPGHIIFVTQFVDLFGYKGLK